MATTDGLNTNSLFGQGFGQSSGVTFGDINNAMPSSWNNQIKPLQSLKSPGISNAGKGINTTAGSGTPGKGMSMAGANYGGMASSLIGAASNISAVQSSGAPSYRKDSASIQAGVDGISAALASTGPWGMAAAAVIKGVDIGGKYLRKVPGAVKNFGVNEELKSSSAFGNLMSDSFKLKDKADAMSQGGFFAGLSFNRKKMKAEAERLTAMQNTATGLKRQSDIARDSVISSVGMKSDELARKNNGIDMYNTAMGKNGMKILRKADFVDLFEEVRKAALAKKEVPVFEDGGKFNVIAEGVLHEEKNNISENEQLKDADITENGIPVVSFEEGGEIKQHAEVEKDELVLNIDTTTSLEELFKDGSDAAMIKAGKIFAKEIVKNTRDSKSKIIENA